MLYYTYLIFRNGLPIYVGSGTNVRMKESLRDQAGDDCCKVYWTSSREEAVAMERAYYFYLLHLGFELLNRCTPASKGNPGYKHTDEDRQRMSMLQAERQTSEEARQHQRERSFEVQNRPEVKERNRQAQMGNQRRTGIPHTEETKQK